MNPNHTALAQLLGKLELGFSLFCDRKAKQAEAEDMPDLALLLRRQAKEEYSHAMRFYRYLGLEIRYPFSYLEERGHFNLRSDERLLEPDPEGFNFDGISQRYWVARFYFGGREARDFDWSDTLAFLAIGEELGRRFYYRSAPYQAEGLNTIFMAIAQDEERHQFNLMEALIRLAGVKKSRQLLLKWRIRREIALLLLPLDLMRLVPH